MLEAVTHNIRVTVETEYAPGRSNPAQSQWFFLYTIKLINQGKETVQLLSRHWIITDAMGDVKEVRGPGVVSKKPVLEPGGSFEYTSGAELTTPFGTMRGTYQMVTVSDNPETFDVNIPQFTLTEPYTTVH
ncbi:MAG: Co2+/Mg2+ efflux protein ApaG [Vicinamibacterales bacterium]|nr:Co2+/Mg2+ efflux protein ApaG [Vicinamibacterales bacterium]